MRRPPFSAACRSSLSLACALAVVAGLPACGKDTSGTPATPTDAAVRPVASQAVVPAATAPAAPLGKAELGKPAPDFTLRDLDGKEVSLASFKGKAVVLEWFNPGCPFVKRSHTKGSLKDLAARRAKDGVVWLAVNSSAAGREGHAASDNRQAAAAWAMTHPILVDESGQVGRAYGATNTPHMFVIDAAGTLIYRGAIDNSPDGEGESTPDGKLVVYVDDALAASRSGKAVTVADTKAYGCSVKYGK